MTNRFATMDDDGLVLCFRCQRRVLFADTCACHTTCAPCCKSFSRRGPIIDDEERDMRGRVVRREDDEFPKPGGSK